MELYKDDYEQGIKVVKAQLKDSIIQSMLAENTLKFLQEKAEKAKHNPNFKKEPKIPTGV